MTRPVIEMPRQIPGVLNVYRPRLETGARRDRMLLNLAQVLIETPGEDLKQISPDDLVRNRFVFTIEDNNGDLMGFAREAAIFPVEVNGTPITAGEIGSVWVPSDHRGKGIGASLATASAVKLVNENTLPIAVCNPAGREAFERAEFTPIGTMLNERTVMTYVNFPGLVGQLADFPRFEGLEPIAA